MIVIYLRIPYVYIWLLTYPIPAIIVLFIASWFQTYFTSGLSFWSCGTSFWRSITSGRYQRWQTSSIFMFDFVGATANFESVYTIVQIQNLWKVYSETQGCGAGWKHPILPKTTSPDRLQLWQRCILTSCFVFFVLMTFFNFVKFGFLTVTRYCQEPEPEPTCLCSGSGSATLGT